VRPHPGAPSHDMRPMPFAQCLPCPLAPVFVAFAMLAATAGCAIDYQLGNDPRIVTVAVAADQDWTDTGVDVVAGERLRINYVSGKWSPWTGGSYDAIGSGGDPRCDCNRMMGVSHAALIGRLGDDDPFLVGDHWEQVVGQGGRLFLGMNDSRLDDNSGELEVRVETGF
jgi:hypothetical protein